MRRSIRTCTRLFAASLLVVCAGTQTARGQDDEFVRQRDAEAAASNDPRFSISFADDRRSFHPGEAIKLVFSFTRYNDVSPYNYEHCHGLGVAVAVLDHADGLVDPQADLWDNGIVPPSCGILSGVVGGIVASGQPYVPRPLEFAAYLNQVYRFDRAGRYRVYIRSRHNFILNNDRAERLPLISNILEFDIVDRDPAWEAARLEQAISVLESTSDAVARREATRAISYLATDSALDEMVRRYDPADPSLPSDWVRGFYGSRDRARVVEKLQQQLDRTDRRIGPAFISLLSLLDLTGQNGTRPVDRSSYESLARSYSTRHLSALKTAGVLQRSLAETFVRAAESTSVPAAAYGLTAAFAAFPDDVEAALSQLKPDDQRRILRENRNWTLFRDPAFKPMLRRLAVTGTREGPEAIALRIFYELDPAEGRTLALSELSKLNSRVSISGFRMIPDRELPRLDKAFVQMMERATTADEYRFAIARIERFATKKAAGRVRRAYERFNDSRSCRLAPPALAYFFRVDPTYARAEILNVMKVADADGCRESVLAAIAERRMSRELEDVAIGLLRHTSGRTVADAARMLQEFGSARSEAMLWDALERWNVEWKNRPEDLEAVQDDPGGVSSWRGSLERELSTALMEGAAWLMTDESRVRLESLCVSPACRRSITSAFPSRERVPSITVFPSGLPGDEPTFVARESTFTRLRSRDALYKWVSLHSKGTTFTWQDRSALYGFRPLSDDHWHAGESERLFEAARLTVERYGMTLTRQR